MLETLPTSVKLYLIKITPALVAWVTIRQLLLQTNCKEQREMGSNWKHPPL